MNRYFVLPALLLFACEAPQAVPSPVATPSTPERSSSQRGCGQRTVMARIWNQVFELGSDGSKRLLFEFKDDTRAPYWVFGTWEMQGDFVGGYARTWAKGESRHEFVVIRRDGRIVFHRVLPELAVQPVVYVGVDGTLAVAADDAWVGLPDGTAEGTVVTLDGAWPVGPSAGGLVPVAMSASSALSRPPTLDAMYRIGSQAIEALPYEPADDGAFLVVAQSLFFQTRGAIAEVTADGSRLYATQGREQVERLPGPGPSQTPRRLVLSSGASKGRRVLDREARTIEDVAWPEREVHQDHVWVQGDSGQLAVDSTGSILAGFSKWEGSVGEEVSLEVQRTLDLGRTWTPVGSPLTLSGLGPRREWTVNRVVAGAVMTAVVGLPRERHYTRSVRLLTPERAVEIPAEAETSPTPWIPGWSQPLVDITADGTCVATWRITGPVTEPGASPLGGEATIVFTDDQGTSVTGASVSVAGTLSFTR